MVTSNCFMLRVRDAVSRRASFFILVGNVEEGIVGLIQGVAKDEVAQGDAVELADVAPPVVLDEDFF